MRPKKISDQDILTTVRQCLMQHGSKVSTQYIADQLGVSQATLFKRFGNKTELLKLAILLPSQAQYLLDLLENEPSEEPVLDQLTVLCLGMIHLFDEALPVWASLHNSGMPIPESMPDNAPPIRARKALTRWLEKLQEQDRMRHNVNPESIAIAIIGAMQHRSWRMHIVKDHAITQTEEEYVLSFLDVLWMGLRPQNGR